jgi:hypothetical protein
MIQGCMIGIPEATAVILTTAERSELEGLARSTKTEYRLRRRARIVLLAADGMASRAIGRTVGCTTGTASKWRVRIHDSLMTFGGGWRRCRQNRDYHPITARGRGRPARKSLNPNGSLRVSLLDNR